MGEQSGWRTAALVLLVVVVLLGWGYLGALGDRDAAEAGRVELVHARALERQATEEKSLDVEAQLVVARVRLASREERFRLMSFACTRLVNHYVERLKYLEMLTDRYFETGVSAAVLQDDLYGYTRYFYTFDPNGYLLAQDRAGCGMREQAPMSLHKDEFVEPVPKDWVKGAEPVEW